VTIGTNGRVASCTVTSSSGTSDLDRGACDGLQRYAEFNPALDSAGNPITDSYSTRVTYRLQ
jgi:protein TonB